MAGPDKDSEHYSVDEDVTFKNPLEVKAILDKPIRHVVRVEHEGETGPAPEERPWWSPSPRKGFWTLVTGTASALVGSFTIVEFEPAWIIDPFKRIVREAVYEEPKPIFAENTEYLLVTCASNTARVLRPTPAQLVGLNECPPGHSSSSAFFQIDRADIPKQIIDLEINSGAGGRTPPYTISKVKLTTRGVRLGTEESIERSDPLWFAPRPEPGTQLYRCEQALNGVATGIAGRVCGGALRVTSIQTISAERMMVSGTTITIPQSD